MNGYKQHRHHVDRRRLFGFAIESKNEEVVEAIVRQKIVMSNDEDRVDMSTLDRVRSDLTCLRVPVDTFSLRSASSLSNLMLMSSANSGTTWMTSLDGLLTSLCLSFTLPKVTQLRTQGIIARKVVKGKS